ncbi:MAG: YabP/YqfC family sporulation protein [Bacillota bacterium]|nr:YabP/YqfC family sporulation protein [Bacillota bacterium]
MSKKELFRTAIADSLELPTDIVAGQPRLVLTGSDRALIENHSGIVHYDDSRLVLNYGGGRLEIKGCRLTLPLLRSDILRVEGEFTSVAFISAGDGS